MRGKSFLLFTVVILLFSGCEMKKRKKNKENSYPSEKQLVLQRKETTPVDFTRLLVMRVVYGLAKVMGYREPLSEVLNGAFVPPGAEDDDDDDFDSDIFGEDDDY